MNTFSQHPQRLTALLEHAIREQKRCEHLQDAWAAVDSEAADACQFDAGALSACRRILGALQDGEDVLADIEALIGLVAALNAGRGMDEP